MVADTKQQEEFDIARYERAVHAVQSGVKIEMESKVSEAHTPKHLRVGVNAAMIEHSALALLLINKGIITRAEYLAALADSAEAERDRYEQRLTQHFGTKITLA